MNHSEHSPQAQSHTTGCVLVVDDNDPVRQMLSLALETAGFDVVEARTQLELQRQLACTRPDALVLDLQRSEADGLDLLTRMRARHHLEDVPIVFLAGSEDDEFRWQALHAGADWFALRPLGMLELQARVGELIRTGRPRAQTERMPRPPTPIRRLKRTG
jgi:two-component system phosphate regulon response regulator PhoB